jgi:hypothetical protein
MVLLGNPKGYHSIEVGNIAPNKIKKILKNGGRLHLTAEELAGRGQKLYLHPESHKKAQLAKSKNKGIHLMFADPELRHNIENGGSLWDTIKSGAKSVGKFLNDNKTTILDGLAGAANAVLGPGAAPYVDVARNVARAVTGGKVKRTKEELHSMRIKNLEKARSARKGKMLHINNTGGSFLQAGY